MTNTISKKYSKALFMATKAKENTKAVLGELEAVYKATSGNAELKNFFDDPMTESSTKLTAFKNAVSKQTLSSEANEFVNLLIRNKRFGHLGTILSDVKTLMDQEQGVQRGVIKSAQTLDPETIRKVEAEFEKVMKSKVQLVFQQSPELLGGIVAEVAGFTFDDSLANHLNKLSENLIRQ